MCKFESGHTLRAALLVAAMLALTTGCSPEKESSQAAGTPALPPAHPPIGAMPGTANLPQTAAANPLPTDHPPVTDKGLSNLQHPKSGAQTTVQVPAEVKARWKAVQLGVRRSGGAEKIERVAIGGMVAIPESPRAIRVAAFLPAFTSNAGTATSSSNEPKNPAVLLELTDGKQTLGRGWVFQNLPEFNTFDSDNVQVRLLGGLTQ